MLNDLLYAHICIYMCVCLYVCMHTRCVLTGWTLEMAKRLILKNARVQGFDKNASYILDLYVLPSNHQHKVMTRFNYMQKLWCCEINHKN